MPDHYFISRPTGTSHWLLDLMSLKDVAYKVPASKEGVELLLTMKRHTQFFMGACAAPLLTAPIALNFFKSPSEPLFGVIVYALGLLACVISLYTNYLVFYEISQREKDVHLHLANKDLNDSRNTFHVPILNGRGVYLTEQLPLFGYISVLAIVFVNLLMSL